MAFAQIDKMESSMQEVVDSFRSDISQIRTGRANSALVENIKVSYYGNDVALKTIASIAVPDASLIVIQPWDAGALTQIESAFRNSNLGFGITNDGHVIRLAIPPMTTERREEMSKMLREIAEESKIHLRNLRRDVWDEVQKKEKNSEISEDEKYDAQKKLQSAIEKFEGEIDTELKKKESEIKQI